MVADGRLNICLNLKADKLFDTKNYSRQGTNVNIFCNIKLKLGQHKKLIKREEKPDFIKF